MAEPEERIVGVTLGEVYRAIQQLNRRLDSFVTNDRYAAEQKALDDRIKDLAGDIATLEEGRRWNFRFAITALITGLVMPVLVAVIVLTVLGGR